MMIDRKISSLLIAILLFALSLYFDGKALRGGDVKSSSIEMKTQQQLLEVKLNDNDDDAAMMERSFLIEDDDVVVVEFEETSKNNRFVCELEPCGVSLVFMGDSLSRFQYYSLVYFLRHGEWIDPQSYPNLVRPMDFLGGFELNFEWSPWFNASMEALQPYENCDCYREAGRLNGQGGKLPFICENRYYHDPVRNNTVTFLQAFGTAAPIRGHWMAKDAIAQLLQYHETKNKSAVGDTVGPMVSRVPYLWQGTWTDVIRGHVADLAPSVLIMNAGKWLHSFDDATFRAEIVNALKDAPIPRVLWKTTTADRGGRYTYNETDHAMCELLECLDTRWTVDVPSNLYVDQGHFTEPVYRLLNEQLLYQLGIKIPGSVSSDVNLSSVLWYPEHLPIPGLRTLADTQ
jgi:hypothetical protein